jgi:two-component system response regulator YesN
VDDDAYRSAKEMRTLAAMSAKTSEIVARAAATVENQGKTRTHLVVKKAQLFIERHSARKNVTLELIAEHAAVSPSYISTVFKKELGLSVIEYLTATRLEAAKRLMDADPLGTIIAVADRVGYSDPYYFSKCFRKHFGVAPTVYLRGRILRCWTERKSGN